MLANVHNPTPFADPALCFPSSYRYVNLFRERQALWVGHGTTHLQEFCTTRLLQEDGYIILIMRPNGQENHIPETVLGNTDSN